MVRLPLIFVWKSLLSNILMHMLLVMQYNSTSKHAELSQSNSLVLFTLCLFYEIFISKKQADVDDNTAKFNWTASSQEQTTVSISPQNIWQDTRPTFCDSLCTREVGTTSRQYVPAKRTACWHSCWQLIMVYDLPVLQTTFFSIIVLWWKSFFACRTQHTQYIFVCHEKSEMHPVWTF